MPLFEYRCRKCGHVTAFLEKADTKGRHACEECDSIVTEKLFSTFAARSGAGSSSDDAACSDDSCPYSGQCPNASCMDE